MGAGKSTVGRRLALSLGKYFVDADQELERRTGVGIPVIFELEGEAGFRKREEALLAELVMRNNIVLATGGGAVLSSQNRERLKERGFVVHLTASIGLLVERTSRDRQRPLMQTADPMATMRALMHQRTPLYRECADLTVNSTRRSSRLVVDEILSRFESDALENRTGVDSQ
ncbi:MAG: shikimate kinase [Ectothiorhodospiraceae bacterium AqS1]|nr:shikimate kinase [Ectothiorhodospiraceae bacterium AqS1]